MAYDKITIPSEGNKINMKNGILEVPDNPIIPFIEGDGIGVDITPAMINVVDNAVKIAYGGEKKIHWMEVYCGEKSTTIYDKDTWLPDETLDALKEYVVSIKGPLTTPIGGGIRSLNVSLRQILDLYVCLRPVRYFDGVPSPVKRPDFVDMVIFRENSEDIYCGIEFEAGTDEATKMVKTLQNEFKTDKIRFPENVGIGVKPISYEGTSRLVQNAIDYAIANDRSSVTLVHKGNIMKFTEGAFRDWGYEIANKKYGGSIDKVFRIQDVSSIETITDKYDVSIASGVAGNIGGPAYLPEKLKSMLHNMYVRSNTVLVNFPSNRATNRAENVEYFSPEYVLSQALNITDNVKIIHRNRFDFLLRLDHNE